MSRRTSDDRPGLDFVVTDEEIGPDEELPEPVRSGRGWPLAAGALVLVGLVIAAVHTGGRSSSGGPDGSVGSNAAEPAPAIPSVPVVTLPTVAIVPAARGVHDVGTVAGGVDGCPAGTRCEQVSGLPAQALGPLQAAFADLELVTATSLLSTRAGHRVLISRTAVAHVGGTDVVVDIEPAERGDVAVSMVRSNGTRITSIQRLDTAGYTVMLTVSRDDGDAPQPRVPLPELVADHALEAVR